MAIPKRANLLKIIALFLVAQQAIMTPLPSAAKPNPAQNAAATNGHSNLIRAYLLDLYECWKSARSGTSMKTDKCLAATGDEHPSRRIAEAESITATPGKGEHIVAVYIPAHEG